MPIQTTYGFTYDKAQKGQTTVSNSDRNISAYATAAIPFGIGVAYDGAGTEESPRVKTPTATTDTLIGITCKVLKESTGADRDFLSVVTSTTQGARYEAADPITVRVLGEIWVYAEAAVNPSLPVFVRCLSNDTLLAGDFRTDANNATITNVALTSNVATITTSAAHGFVVGQTVTITGLTNTALNGTYAVTAVPSATTFTFARTNSNITSTADSGTIARAIAVPNARWKSINTVAGLALLELF